jgi:hypothetical protein
MKQECKNCRFFSGLINRLDPVLWDLHYQTTQLKNKVAIGLGNYSRIVPDAEEIEACKKQGGVCMRYPKQKDPRPVIWDGDDWCGEWQQINLPDGSRE